jgi:hypothetical protein
MIALSGGADPALPPHPLSSADQVTPHKNPRKSKISVVLN